MPDKTNKEHISHSTTNDASSLHYATFPSPNAVGKRIYSQSRIKPVADPDFELSGGGGGGGRGVFY